MERRRKTKVEETPIVEGPKKLRWKKVGGGAHYTADRIIKPGEVFEATLDEIPKAFMDQFECLDGDAEALTATEEALVDIPTTFYEVVKTDENSELFNIVDSFGKQMNESPLTKEEAEQIKVGLEV